MRHFIVSLFSISVTLSSFAALSNVTLPDIPTLKFYKITDYNAEKSQRQTISIPYEITADGSGDLNISVTVTHPGVNGATHCQADPQGDTKATCMENIDDGVQQVFYDLAYKPCGYIDQIPVSSNANDTVSITLSNPNQYHLSACQNDPTLTQGRLVLIRLPFPRTVPSYDPSSGIYSSTITITTSNII